MDREKDIHTHYSPVGLFLLATGLKETQTNGCTGTVKQIMWHRECRLALHRSSLHTELRLEGLPLAASKLCSAICNLCALYKVLWERQ